ncbi:MAG: hypothetical protein EA427_01185 [Spirochaetaceae bacterium]|nr:MAG: hypothetical protein EA427_01185 [Spirochaetaceae bacterium]
MMQKGRILVAILTGLIALALFSVAALELDQTELESALDAEIEFESYMGPVDRIDSREAIRGIGLFLGNRVAPGVTADYHERYRAYRIVGDPLDPRRAADVIELDARSRVDHIDNLRRIVGGYLESAWGYGTSDADLLARFITIYNAVHRGEMPFFAARYRAEVSAALREASVGLAISYRQWPGQTQLVIPIRDDRERGALDAVDPASLIDRAVLADLRSRADLGIDDRKAIIAFIERVIEERAEAIAEEREAIEAERAAIAEEPPAPEPAEEDIAAAPPQPDPAPADPAPTPPVDPDPPPADPPPVDPEAPPAEPAPDDPDPPPAEPDPAPTAPEPTPERIELEEREEALARREEELRIQEEELEALTEQLEELYQETADDQRTLLDADLPGEHVPFIIAERPGTGYELALVDMNRLEIAGVQTIPLADRSLEMYQGRLLVIHRTSRRLLLLHPDTMEIEEESERTVRAASRLRVSGGTILAGVEEGGSSYIGSLDSQLVQTRRSVEPVAPDTDIVIRGEQVLVQDPDGSFRILLLRSLE